MKTTISILLFLLLAVVMTSCGSSVKDSDGNIYKTVKIGNQEWMAENLKVTHYRNGDAIPHVTDNGEWWNLTTGAYFEYDNDTSHVEIYGRLYNWYSVNDTRGLAPEGWHVPSDAEWKTLRDHFGGSSDYGGKMKETGTTHWSSPNTLANNESGFSALPGGVRGYKGDYTQVGESAHFWSSAESSILYAWGRWLAYDTFFIAQTNGSKQCGYSVRCVRD